MGLPGEVDAEAVRRGETRSFANQDRHRAGFQGFANIIPQRHPRLMRQHYRRQADTQRLQIGQQGADQWHRLALYRPGREAIADHQQQIGGADAAGGEVGAAFVGELPPEIRTPKIGVTVRRGAAHRQGVEAERRQRRHQLLAGERLMNGIPRSGVGQTKVENFAGRQAGAAAPQGDPRIGKFTQRVPGIGTIHTEAPCGRTDSSGWRASVSRSVPCGSIICIFASQSANSGACFKPSRRRAYSASWNEVLW